MFEQIKQKISIKEFAKKDMSLIKTLIAFVIVIIFFQSSLFFVNTQQRNYFDLTEIFYGAFALLVLFVTEIVLLLLQAIVLTSKITPKILYSFAKKIIFSSSIFMTIIILPHILIGAARLINIQNYFFHGGLLLALIIGGLMVLTALVWIYFIIRLTKEFFNISLNQNPIRIIISLILIIPLISIHIFFSLALIIVT